MATRSTSRNRGTSQPTLPTQSNVITADPSLPPVLHHPSSSASTEVTRHEARKNLKVAIYTGKDYQVHIDAWLRVFEVIMYEETDRNKRYLVVRYLDGPALTWFSRHIIPDLESITWSDVKERLIKRFKETTIRPIIAAQKRYLKSSETVQNYFNEKLRLLMDTNLEEQDMVALLTEGMPLIYKPHLIAAHIASTNDWLAISLELESNYKRKPEIPSTTSAVDSKSYTGQPRNGYHSSGRFSGHAQATAINEKKKDKKPATPCRYCTDAGLTEYHWQSTCSKNPRVIKSGETPTTTPNQESSNMAFPKNE